MAKFKKGDRVRRIKSNNLAGLIGYTGTVNEVYGKSVYVNWDAYPASNEVNDEVNLEKIENKFGLEEAYFPPPVTPITRVKEGTYTINGVHSVHLKESILGNGVNLSINNGVEYLWSYASVKRLKDFIDELLEAMEKSGLKNG